MIKLGLRNLGYTRVRFDGGRFNLNRGEMNATGYPTTQYDLKVIVTDLHSKQMTLGMYVTGGFVDVYEKADNFRKLGS